MLLKSLNSTAPAKAHLPAIQGAWHGQFTPVLVPAAFAKEIHASHTHNLYEKQEKKKIYIYIK